MDAAEAQNTNTPMTDENQVCLIVRGDDSGMCHSANTAVLDAFRNGILRNTSVMVPCPAFAEACEMHSRMGTPYWLAFNNLEQARMF